MSIDGFLWVVNGISAVLAFIGVLNISKNPLAAVIAFALAGVFLLLSLDIAKGFWIGIGVGA